MSKNYINVIIVVFWVILAFLLSLPPIPGMAVVFWISYTLVAIWFLMAWRRNEVLTIAVKVPATIGLMYCFFMLRGSMYLMITMVRLTKGAPMYVKICNIISNEFIAIFIAAIIISPMIIVMYNKYYMYASLIIAAPTLCFMSYLDISNINKASLTAGIFSAQILAVIIATYLAAVILNRFVKTKGATVGLVTDAGPERVA